MLMRKKILLTVLTILLAVTGTGCESETAPETYSGSPENSETVQIKENQPEENMTSETKEGDVTADAEGKDVTGETEGENTTVQTEKNDMPVQAKEENTTEETETVNTETVEAENTEFTFLDLSKRQFEFSSGAGGWSEEFVIEKDGYFKGKYHDSDMGDTGEGYDNGTFYSSSYSGHFTDLTKIDSHTYRMKLADIAYEEAADTTEIKDGIRYIYTEAYCLGGTDSFMVYLPGTPLDKLPQDVYLWISGINQSQSELTMIVIADETNGYGIYSYDRLEPSEDARWTFDSYKESYDYYSDKVTEAGTTAEMAEYTAIMYELSDECLNYIWNLIRYNTDEEKYNEILAKQRAWIAEKETRAEEVMAEYAGGSFATVAYNDMLASLTIERCEELIEYLE